MDEFQQAEKADVAGWLVDMLEKALPTPAELMVFDWGMDGTAVSKGTKAWRHAGQLSHSCDDVD